MTTPDDTHPTPLPDSFLRHAVACPSQYDSTCRQLAAEVLKLRADVSTKDAALRQVAEAFRDGWLIWSCEHECWWRPDSRGYTSRAEEAGRYSLEDAKRICRIGFRSPRRNGKPDEVMVPSPELLARLAACELALEGERR